MVIFHTYISLPEGTEYRPCNNITYVSPPDSSCICIMVMSRATPVAGWFTKEECDIVDEQEDPHGLETFNQKVDKLGEIEIDDCYPLVIKHGNGNSL